MKMPITTRVIVSSLLLLLTIDPPVDSVINGEFALRNEFMSTIRLVYKSGNNIDHPRCTGVILNEILVLTAGHCLDDIKDLRNIEMIAGTYNRMNSKTEQRGKVVESFSHPTIDYIDAMSNDLAILRLDTPLVFGDAVEKVSLPKTDFYAKGDLVFAGWGRHTKPEEPTKYPDILQKAILQIVDTKTCKEWYENFLGGKIIKFSGALCGFNAYATLSRGDSGGGAFYRNGTEKVLAGILSYNVDSGPVVFTRIDKETVEWIRQIFINNEQYLNVKTDSKNYKSDIIMYIALAIGLALVIIIIIVYYVYRRRKRYDSLTQTNKLQGEGNCGFYSNYTSQTSIVQ